MLLAALGIALLLAVAGDVVATTVTGSYPGGWLTRRFGRILWSGARRVAGGRHAVLQISGIAIVVALLLTWVLLLLTGWWLVLVGVGEVETAATGRPVSAWDTLYMAGYTVSTLGNGELVPGSGPGRAAVVAGSVSGILVLTLSITYLVPALGAVASKRCLAVQIHSMGTTGRDLAAALWPDGDLEANRDEVMDLAGQIRTMAQQLYSYPVVHYFHSRERRTALAPAIAALDDGLRRVDGYHADGPAGRPLHIHQLDRAIGDLLRALETSFVTPGDDEEPRRAMLREFVEDDGWAWDDVLAEDPPRPDGTGRP